MILNGSERGNRDSQGKAVLLRLGDPDKHFWLVRSVARVMGLNLGDAVARGTLGRDEYRGLVNRCRSCPVVDRCESWLAMSGGQAQDTPPGCTVAPDLARLRILTTPTKGAR